MDIKPIEYDVDMDRFYIPVNSRYEIQTKGKGSSFRIANTVTHERHLVSCAYVQAMLEDMAKGTHAELMQQQAEITSLRAELEKAKKDGKRNSWMVRHNAYISWSQDSEVCSVWIIGDNRDDMGDYPAQGYPLKSYNTKEEAIDNAMKAK